jgi:hypothetical protein
VLLPAGVSYEAQVAVADLCKVQLAASVFLDARLSDEDRDHVLATARSIVDVVAERGTPIELELQRLIEAGVLKAPSYTGALMR